jgi:hypothetical protein
MQHKLIVPALLCFASLCLAQTGLAASNNYGDVTDHLKRHHFGVFVGTLDTPEASDPGYGLEYEYRHNAKVGFGLVYEDAPNAHHDDGVSAAIASIYYHPNSHWRLGLGTGRERIGGSHPHDESIHRASIAYEWHFGALGIAPSFNLDRVDGHTSRVYGLSLLLSY